MANTALLNALDIDSIKALVENGRDLREVARNLLVEEGRNASGWKCTLAAHQLRAEIREIVHARFPLIAQQLKADYLSPPELCETWNPRFRSGRTVEALAPHVGNLLERGLENLGATHFPDAPAWKHPFLAAYTIILAKQSGILTAEELSTEQKYRAKVAHQLRAALDTSEAIPSYFAEAHRLQERHTEILKREAISEGARRSGEEAAAKGSGAFALSAEERSELSKNTASMRREKFPEGDHQKGEAIRRSRIRVGVVPLSREQEETLLIRTAADRDFQHLSGRHKGHPDWAKIAPVFNEATGRQASADSLRDWYPDIPRERKAVILLSDGAKRARPMANALVRKFVGHSDEALSEDILQEAVWRGIGHYDPSRSSPQTYLMRAVRNRLIDISRSKSRRGDQISLDAEKSEDLGLIASVLADSSMNSDPSHTLATKELYERACLAIGKLPSAEQTAVQMILIDNLKIAEAARKMEVTPAVMRQIFERARRTLLRDLANAA